MYLFIIVCVVLISLALIFFFLQSNEKITTDNAYKISENIKLKENTYTEGNIKAIEHAVMPSIFDDQKYFFAQAKYKNLKFSQMVRSGDYVSRFIEKQGAWPECQDIFNVYLTGKKDGVFLDLGANIGSCSFVFAQAGVKVYAFEPLPNNLFPFTVTTFSNPSFAKLITIYPYALGKREEDQVMKIDKTNWGVSSFYYKINEANISETIHVKKLDEFDKLIPTTVSMVKIDVEGAEYDLLEGGKEFFKTHKTEFIHMEAECGSKDKDGKYDIEKLFNLLNDMGYDVLRKFNCSVTTKDNIVAKIK